jgi:class 3 adenylate cyclase
VKVAAADRLIVTLDDTSRERRLQDLLAKTQSRGIAQLMKKGADFGLSGAIHRVSILFSDVRDFTALSEKLGGAGTVTMLNEYFSFMADIIHDRDGQIDKYIGDAIMALFGAPLAGDDDADRAVAAARGMIGALELFNERRTESQSSPIRIGIGVATGPVVAGAIGSPDRMNYTVVGDAANLAARIEALTKPYGASILVCGETVAALKKPVPMRQVDLLRVGVRRRQRTSTRFLSTRTSRTAPQAAKPSTRLSPFTARAPLPRPPTLSMRRSVFLLVTG